MKIEKLLPGIKKNILLKNYTTFKIGGPAKYFFIAKSKQELIEAVKTAKRANLPFFVLGGGSKLLISDKGFKGLIIKIINTKYKILNTKIIAESGTTLAELVNAATRAGVSGLEWAAGIPGATVGGAVRGNAGAFGGSMADIIKNVEVFNTKDLKIKNFNPKDCQFGYRESIFKKNKNLIIVSVALQLKKITKKNIKKKIERYLSHRKKIQSFKFPSAGSIFKNPKGFSAGELIEKCDLKGKRIGNVKISEKHANFIVNLGGGKATDVKKLINLVKNKVKNKFGIILEEEIQILE